tara:strand:- start:323 stop:448 length:126 start_codon:yes stop_codon:yes gene_type:complete
MTEKEKMLSGQNYLARDPELILHIKIAEKFFLNLTQLHQIM